ncbi:hypothetical protein AN618_10510 [Fervidicola ferrireducens]|uniref:Uncharacterized protein n=1 Tax=Fervidicola ferrireducens TaxID=520764 RepID=A0A140LAC4_9FIRM|nr:hypothetical protein AN618_10510 [Fervidicola ferrireducens]
MNETIIWMVIMISIFLGGFLYYANIAAKGEQRKR